MEGKSVRNQNETPVTGTTLPYYAPTYSQGNYNMFQGTPTTYNSHPSFSNGDYLGLSHYSAFTPVS